MLPDEDRRRMPAYTRSSASGASRGSTDRIQLIARRIVPERSTPPQDVVKARRREHRRVASMGSRTYAGCPMTGTPPHYSRGARLIALAALAVLAARPVTATPQWPPRPAAGGRR